jgi:predicted RNase H-like HicB family nuclease
MDTELIDQYRIVTYWSEDDDAFIAEMPELPGCLSDGPTEADARRNIRVIAQEWINRARYLGREIPAPEGLLVA